MNINNKQVTVSLAIQKPVADVFQAFIDPVHTTKFWFSESTGKLIKGERVTWTWEWYNFTADVEVIDINENKNIFFNWTGGNKTTHVDISFFEINPSMTFLVITQFGFSGQGDELLAALQDSNGGFSLVAAGAKAYLEHGISIGLIQDKYPAEVKTYFEKQKETNG